MSRAQYVNETVPVAHTAGRPEETDCLLITLSYDMEWKREVLNEGQDNIRRPPLALAV